MKRYRLFAMLFVLALLAGCAGISGNSPPAAPSLPQGSGGSELPSGDLASVRVIGTYYETTLMPDDKDLAHRIELNDDGTFVFWVNFAAGMGKITGNYTLRGETIDCAVGKVHFSGFTGDDVESFGFSVLDDSRLGYRGGQIALLSDGDIFDRNLFASDSSAGDHAAGEGLPESSRQAVLDAVNTVLAGYADGTFPHPPSDRYNQNGGYMVYAVPKDTALPPRVEYSQLDVDYKGEDYVADYWVDLPLENSYTMEFLISSKMDESRFFVMDASFKDELEALSIPVLSDHFKNVNENRIIVHAEYENVEVEGDAGPMTISGAFTWKKLLGDFTVSVTRYGSSYNAGSLFPGPDGQWAVHEFHHCYYESNDGPGAYPPPFDTVARAENTVNVLFALFSEAYAL